MPTSPMPAREPSHQLELFGADTAAPARLRAQRREGPVGPADVPEDVAELGGHLPAGVHLGTSSWTFPGWEGLVYDRPASTARLAREGLAAYARHPLLRTVGVDRTFYRPLPAEALGAYAAAVPDDFRFLVKAHQWLTHPDARPGAPRAGPSPHFLDAAYARDAVVAPFVEGLGLKAGPLLFQFPPQDVAALGGPARFAEALHRFLGALPRGPLYAVEVRNGELFTGDFAWALADAGACPALSVWGRLPSVAWQAARTGALSSRALVVRWMLPPHLGYEAAGERYAPYAQLVDEDVATREAIARLCVDAVHAGRRAFVIINNNAEGSAPLSALRLARRIVLEHGSC